MRAHREHRRDEVSSQAAGSGLFEVTRTRENRREEKAQQLVAGATAAAGHTG
jgi:hypothetical protein